MNILSILFIEKAIQMNTIKAEEEMKVYILDQTFGSWNREESATEIVKKTRKAFQDNMLRHQR